MRTIDPKSFLTGAVVVALIAILFIFRDDLFTREVKIEIFDQVTSQTRVFEGSGTMRLIIQYPQITTDWRRQFEIYAYLERVSAGRFRIPERFYEYVEHPGCIEAGCVANFSFEGIDSLRNENVFCRSVDFSERARKNKDAIVFRCD